MTLQQLQYLLMAQQTNSISKAAENLFIAPSSVSACINSLEKELGFPIFIRNQKGLVPTPKGESVLEYAQRMVRLYNQMANLGQETQLHLHLVATNYYPSCAAFARLVAE
jgi:DNA-binding transcriptional LysR family regulator